MYVLASRIVREILLRRSMSSDESNQGLAAPQPALQSSQTLDERRDRMRQIANVVIEMFQDLRRSEATPLLEAA